MNGDSPIAWRAPSAARTRLRSALPDLFGDTGGLVVFLAATVFLGGLWRIDFLMNDSVTVGNLLVNVADGHLAVTDAPYAMTAGEQPGLVEVDGKLYGRNYGQVYLAVPALWLLDAVAGIVDLRLLLAAGWSLSVLGLSRALAGLLDRPVLAPVGAAVALGLFAASLVLATTVDWIGRPRPVVALGLTTLLLAALAATVLYRLLTWAHDRRVGLVGGLGLVLATPVGFWGSFPKRHALSATVLLVVCYLFAVSRTGTDRRATLARAGAYAAIGFLTSVHAFEAAFAFAVFLPLDLLTAPSNDRRTLALVLVVFAVSLLPMLATNAAISGDPLQPPRTLPGAEGELSLDGSQAPDAGGGSGGAGGGSGGAGGGSGGGLPFVDLFQPLFGFLARFLWIGEYMLGALLAGVAVLTEFERLGHVFLRSGWIPGVVYHRTGFEALELAFLEALPLSGALLALPALVVARARRGLESSLRQLRDQLADPVRQTDTLVGALAATMLLVYLPYLPLYATITVRYVVLAVPLVLYAVVRLGPVRAAVHDAPRALAVGYLATVLVGALGLGLVVSVLAPAQGEAIQLHALLGLATGLGAGATVATHPLHDRPGLVAGGLALAAGATTLFLAFSGLVYFADGNHALDVARVVSGLVPPTG